MPFKRIKDAPASQRPLYIGFWWDSVTRTRTLEERKLTEYVRVLLKFAGARVASLHELRSLAGKAERAAMTFPPGARCLVVNFFLLMAGHAGASRAAAHGARHGRGARRDRRRRGRGPRARAREDAGGESGVGSDDEVDANREARRVRRRRRRRDRDRGGSGSDDERRRDVVVVRGRGSGGGASGADRGRGRGRGVGRRRRDAAATPTRETRAIETPWSRTRRPCVEIHRQNPTPSPRRRFPRLRRRRR